ncbi:MAG: transketolase [Actinobacteria bacterium RBG_13_35_12]|nr:MAG: transketolase [Actinobacteria bacterium RBG_13_35_12]
MNLVTKNDLEKLLQTSNLLRLNIIEMLFKIGIEYKGHPGPALSIADIVACLYFKILNIDPKNPDWPDRDRLILSKGHACPAIYAALAMRGYFDKSYLYTFRHIGSILQGHPDMKRTPGIDMTAGSLGNGLGAGVGMALAGKLDKKKYKTYVILGDGEMQEGLVWEAIMSAGHYKLDNLTAIVDKNRWQSCDSIECTIGIDPLAEKIKSFNWEFIEIDGHDIKQISEALSRDPSGRPLAIIAKTIKGKGISFMEENNSWHQSSINKEQYDLAISELSKVKYL